MSKVPMTITGHQRLSEQLKHLKTVERPTVIEAIARARDHGDLSENAEYHAARERQSFIEGRIRELEDRLNRAEVVDPAKLSGSVIKFGATVTLTDTQNNQRMRYQIVGQDESDIQSGFLSITSPLARALIGKKSGDSIDVKTPNSVKSYDIIKIDYT